MQEINPDTCEEEIKLNDIETVYALKLFILI